MNNHLLKFRCILYCRLDSEKNLYTAFVHLEILYIEDFHAHMHKYLSVSLFVRLISYRLSVVFHKLEQLLLERGIMNSL